MAPWRPPPLLGLLLQLGFVSCYGGAVTPLQKVVQMLDGMVKTAKEEMHQEQLQYVAYESFCTSTLAEKQRAVTEAASQVELLQATVQKHNTEADRLTVEIEGHIAEMASFDEDLKAATVVRSSEREEYMAMQQNYTESLHALSQAIAVLKTQNYDRMGKGPTESFLQGLSVMVPRVGRELQSFLERDSEDPDLTFVPAVPTTAYVPKSSEIISMLEGLHDKFKTELEDLDKEEVQRRAAFDKLAQDRTFAIKAADAAKASKSESKAKNLQLAAEASGQLTDVSASLAADTKYMQELNATCQAKAAEYSSRQSLRKEEIAALQKAVDILSSDEVAGAAAKHLPASLAVRESRAVSLLQLRRRASGAAAPSQIRAAAFLRDASSRIGSHVLSTLAMRLQADPLAKVKQLIEELITRLMTEATAETEHKGWCDSSLAENEHTRQTATQQIETLTAEIEGLSANIAQMKKDLSELTADVKDIESAIANATTLRDAEKAENNASVVEAQEAQAAVTKAIGVLTDFYANASKATALVQHGRQHQEPPPIFDSPYKGQQAESGGVLGMLEVVRSDFARVESDVRSAEAAADAEYKSFMEESRISKAQKEVDIQHKSKSQKDSEAALEDKSSDLENTKEQLGAATAEFEKLKPACLGGGQTYEERVQHRKDEIEALKEALRILEGETPS